MRRECGTAAFAGFADGKWGRFDSTGCWPLQAIGTCAQCTRRNAEWSGSKSNPASMSTLYVSSRISSGRVTITKLTIANLSQTIQLPRLARRSRSASTATAESNSSGTAALHPVEDEYLIATLRQSHRRFRLRHGTLAQLLQREGKVTLLEKLAAHWDRWLCQVDILNSRSLEDVVEGASLWWSASASLSRFELNGICTLQPFPTARS